MIVDIICNECKKFMETVEQEKFDIHHKDYCQECINKLELNFDDL